MAALCQAGLVEKFVDAQDGENGEDDKKKKGKKEKNPAADNDDSDFEVVPATTTAATTKDNNNNSNSNQQWPLPGSYDMRKREPQFAKRVFIVMNNTGNELN